MLTNARRWQTRQPRVVFQSSTVVAKATASCSEGIQSSFDTYPTAEVAFLDASLPYGIPDVSAQVRDMKAAGVDMVATCMDFNGAVTIQQEMRRQELDAVQYMPNAYDYDFLEENGDLFEGAYVLTQFVPFEAEDPPEALTTYEDWIDRTGGTLGDPKPSDLTRVGAGPSLTGTRQGGESRRVGPGAWPVRREPGRWGCPR